MSVAAGEGAPVAVRPGEAGAVTWRSVAGSLTTPYRVPASMVLLVSLVPLYVFIPELLAGRTLHVPELAWDRLIPLQPRWVLLYGPGLAAMLAASLVALSTLFTKQHYLLDVVAGVLMGCVAYAVFVSPFPREKVPELDRRLAPVLALGLLAILGLGVAGAWLVYEGGVG